MAKRVAILGSTGSIGRQALDVIARFPGRLEVAALTAQRDASSLFAQARECMPRRIALADPDADTSGAPVPCLVGPGALAEIAAAEDVDLVLVAVVGTAGLVPTLAALEAGRDVALSTKEALVTGGHLVKAAAAAAGARLLPIDSEHSAILQCVRGSRLEEIERIILTASGGPFVDRPAGEMASITPEEALRHPTWRMGAKITIDSATLMNKGLELIEACWLFDVPPSRVEVVIHRQSIVHSLVEFRDGATLAQLSPPDMRLPIQYALLYPERPQNDLPRLDLARLGRLTFEAPDPARFPCLRLAAAAAERGGSLPAVMSAANEEAVALFLAERIRFDEIAVCIEETMAAHVPVREPSVEEVLAADAWSRKRVHEIADARGASSGVLPAQRAEDHCPLDARGPRQASGVRNPH
jgi:1-deoxy-D-xylulose-5-phosphate reductoisomerase